MCFFAFNGQSQRLKTASLVLVSLKCVSKFKTLLFFESGFKVPPHIWDCFSAYHVFALKQIIRYMEDRSRRLLARKVTGYLQESRKLSTLVRRGKGNIPIPSPSLQFLTWYNNWGGLTKRGQKVLGLLHVLSPLVCICGHCLAKLWRWRWWQSQT